MPSPDGCSQTLQAVFKKHPLRHPRPEQPHDARLVAQDRHGSALWTSSHQAYGSWAYGGPLSQHQQDLRAARGFVKHDNGLAPYHPPPSMSSPSGANRASEHRQPPPLNCDGEAVNQLAAAKEVPSPTGQRPHDVEPMPHAARGHPAMPGLRGGLPGASRGLPWGASNPTWCFERMPSLLPPHLQRDYGKQGRGVSGLPPACYAPPPQEGEEEAHKYPPGQLPVASRVSGTYLGGMRRGASEPKLDPSGPSAPSTFYEPPALRRAASSTAVAQSPTAIKRRGAGGLQGLIGMQWDNAATEAGGCYKGCGGRWVGF